MFAHEEQIIVAHENVFRFHTIEWEIGFFTQQKVYYIFLLND